ncbi:MAG: hypothetical protein KDC84_07630 [Crocinitomicaceae bacterium]|nr:hypothetical protein [Crocinitomicaceae bacterium]
MKDKLDNMWIGMIAAVVIPLIVLSIYASVMSSNGNLSTLYYIIMEQPQFRLKILTIGIIPNLFMFYIVNNRLQMNDFTRGFVLITVLLGIGVIVWTQLFT